MSLIRDVKYKIALSLSDADLRNLCRVNREYANMCNDDSFWQMRLYQRYGKVCRGDCKRRYLYRLGLKAKLIVITAQEIPLINVEGEVNIDDADQYPIDLANIAANKVEQVGGVINPGDVIQDPLMYHLWRNGRAIEIVMDYTVDEDIYEIPRSFTYPQFPFDYWSEALPSANNRHLDIRMLDLLEPVSMEQGQPSALRLNFNGETYYLVELFDGYDGYRETVDRLSDIMADDDAMTDIPVPRYYTVIDDEHHLIMTPDQFRIYNQQL